jgi:hypothetical protein
MVAVLETFDDPDRLQLAKTRGQDLPWCAGVRPDALKP